MVIYVFFGGMLATTWIQIIKAVLLLTGCVFMAFMVLSEFGFSLNQTVQLKPFRFIRPMGQS